MSPDNLRREVTAGSRLILPAYPLLAVALGLLFIFQSPSRTSGAAYDVAKQVLPICWWGVLFLALGLLKAVAWVTGSRAMFMACLTIGAGLCGFWAVLVAAAAYASDTASYTSALWVLFVTLAHLASIKSLTTDRVVR